MFTLKSPLWDENDGSNGGSSGSADLEAVKAEVERLRSHNSKLLDEKKKVESSLKKFDGIDPENFKKMMSAFENNEDARLLAEGKADEVVSKRTEKIRLAAEEKALAFTEKEKTYQDKINTLVSQHADHVISDAIRKEAEKAGVIPAAIDDVIFRTNGIFSLDENGNIESRNANGELVTVRKKPLTPEIAIEQLKETAPHFWPQSKGAGASGGAGIPGYSGQNPWKTGNRTDQAKLLNSDPDLAAKLRNIAGIN